MIHMSFPASADAAAGYYGKSGSEMETVGSYHGKEAARLGLSGPADLKVFRDLLFNRMPGGGQLTANTRHDRRCMMDITVSPPKSVAVMASMFDPRIKDAVKAANADTMRLAETRAQTRITARVRGFKRQERIDTGSLLWVDFTHEITRARDPGLHIHNAVLAVTTHKGKRQSPEFDSIVRASKHLNAAFNANLSHRLRGLGYEIRATKDAFEIAGVPQTVLREFSQRSVQIDRGVLQKGVWLSEELTKAVKDGKDTVKIERAIAKLKAPKGRAAVTVLTRQRKRADLKADKLFNEWLSRLSPNQYKVLGSVTARAEDATKDEIPLFPGVHLGDALEKLLVAVAEVPEERLLTEAMKAGVGEVTLESLQVELAGGEYLRGKLRGVDYVTTRDAMAKKAEIVDFARRGGIRLVRTPKGREVPTEAGKTLIADADRLGFAGRAIAP